MPDRAKVIARLEEAMLLSETANECKVTLGYGIVEDALTLLKAQEPRVLTLEKMWEGEVYWFDCPGNFILRPVICNMYDRGDSSYLNFIWQHGNFSWKICEYGRTWRCWTSRPTDEEREAVKWG